MAHGVGHGQVQGVAVQGVVVGVARDVVGGHQGRREGELGRLATGGRGQELALDLGGQADRGGALAPVVEVGVAAVGDEDVGQRVSGLREPLPHARRDAVEEQLQHAESVPAVGDGDQHARPVGVVRQLGDALGTQHLLVPGAAQRDPVDVVVLAGGGLLGDPHHPAADGVEEEERHVPGIEPFPQVPRHHIEGRDRRGGLRRPQQRRDSDTVPCHDASLVPGPGARPRRANGVLLPRFAATALRRATRRCRPLLQESHV
ncbi:hypothetical protein SDIAM26S_02912 [Streptomyces diastaticus subsp. diastaticus]